LGHWFILNNNPNHKEATMDDTLKRRLETHAATKSRNSIWELTWDYSPSLDTDPTLDSLLPNPIYEVALDNIYIKTSHDVFLTWTGLRRLNGQDYHGHVFNFDTTTPYNGPRHCGCSICETNTHPTAKKN
jgi:hypothetical protein